VAPYKGVVELVAAFASLAVDLPARLVVAGACEDVDYAARLRAACAAAAGPPVQLRLGRLTDAELDALLADSDVLVLPYLEVTTSGSAVLGLGAGLPLLVPDLPGLADLPGAAVLRYPPGDLAAALARVVATSRAELVRMGESGRATVAAHPWSEVATRTAELYRGLVRTAAPG
jgi:glycosyltransferase involved in cell wall biosynthesis